MEDRLEGDYWLGGTEEEPQRKKRCIRYPSEDPLLASDSGFGDLSPPEEGQEDLSLFSTELSDLVPPEEEEDLECKHPEASQSNLSSSGGGSDPCCSSRSSSAVENEEREEEEEEDTETDGPIDDNFIELVLNTKEISGNPERTAMMQRFLSQLRSNPNDAQLQHFLHILLSGPEFTPPRHRLRHVTTIQDAARLLKCSKKILVLTGAGISVSCGIPDFRSKDGLYSRVSRVFPELKDPQSVFDIRLFRRDPRPFFLTAKELYPGQFAPSLSHKFIQKLEARGQLLRNYSQNIDTLETIAGIDKVIMCHGSFASATCIRCRHKVNAEEIKEKVLAGEIPYCKVCSTDEETRDIKYPLGQPPARPTEVGGSSSGIRVEDDDDDDIFPVAENFPVPPVVKPDIVFFGEDLPDEFHNHLQLDKPNCDLVLVIGSSLRVRPVSLIPGMVPADVPQILINRESLPHCRFDVELLGNCDHIIAQLCKMMGSDFLQMTEGPELREIDKLPKGNSEVGGEVSEPTSEHDIQALKACWEPKTNEKLVDRLPPDTYLSWRPRQYIFDGAEEIYDPDEEEDDDSSSSSSSSSDSSSCSSVGGGDENMTRDKEVDDELRVTDGSAAPSSGTNNAPQPTRTQPETFENPMVEVGEKKSN